MPSTAEAAPAVTVQPPVLAVDVLGPLAVRVNGKRVSAPTGRARQLLALLAHRPGQSRTVDELCDQLWPVTLPDGPRQALQVTVSRLRTTLGEAAGLLRTSGSSYQLSVDVDAVRFMERVQAAVDLPSDVRLATLTDLSSTWQSPPLVDIDHTPELDVWTTELTIARDLCDRLLCEAYLEQNRFESAISIARRLVERSPHDERGVRCLATSLARGGHKGEALSVIARLRDSLRRDMGVDPSGTLLELEGDLLHGRVDLAPIHIRGRESARFVGRVEVLDALTTAERPGLVVAWGESGVGKSAIAGEVIRLRRQLGRTVVATSVQPRPSRPLEPITDLLARLSDAIAPSHVDEVARLRLEHGAVTSSREEYIGAVAGCFAQAALNGPLDVILDDAQWLDRTSAAVIQRIAEDGSVCVLAFSRPAGQAVDATWWTPGPNVVAEHWIGEFGRDDVELFLKANHQRLTHPAMVDRLHRQSGGNAMFLSLVADGIAEGVMSSGALPVTLLLAAAERIQRLAPGPQVAIEVAAMVGDEFDVELVTALSPGAQQHIDHAEAQGLIEREGTLGRFRHGVLAEATRQLIAPVRRMDLAERIGEQLVAEGQPASRYVQYFERASALDPVRAGRACLDAGNEHDRQYSHLEAIELYKRASQHLGGVAGEDRLKIAISVQLGSALRRAGDPAHEAELRRAARDAQHLGESAMLVEAVVELCRHGASSVVGEADEELLDLLGAALDCDVDERGSTELCSSAAIVLSFTEQHGRGRALFRSAWTRSSSLPDPAIEANVLMNAYLGLAHPDDHAALGDAARRLGTIAIDDDQRWESAFLTFTQAMMAGDRSTLDGAIEMMRELHERPKHRPRDFGMAFSEAAYHQMLGDLERAERLAEEALTIGLARYSPTWAFGTYLALLVGIRDAAGTFTTLTPILDHAIVDMPGRPALRCLRAFAAALEGDRRRVRAELSVIVPDGSLMLTPDLGWTAAASFAGRAAAAVGDLGACAAIEAALRPYSGRMAWIIATTAGPIDLALADLALARGDRDAGDAALRVAAETIDRLGADSYRARLITMAGQDRS